MESNTLPCFRASGDGPASESPPTSGVKIQGPRWERSGRSPMLGVTAIRAACSRSSPFRSMRRRSVLAGVLCLVSLSAGFTAIEQKQFRVCADPENLPFSNQKLEGFENRIAELLAKEFGAPLSYIWWG